MTYCIIARSKRGHKPFAIGPFEFYEQADEVRQDHERSSYSTHWTYSVGELQDPKSIELPM